MVEPIKKIVMNKLKLLCVSVLLISCFTLTSKAQDCDKLVSPNFSAEIFEHLPAYKMEYYCEYAKAAFYTTNALPEGAVVYPITDVIDNAANQPLSMSVEINLDTFSVYAYNFYSFQHRHWNKEIYFETANTEAKYLVLRPVITIYNMVDEALAAKEQPATESNCEKKK